MNILFELLSELKYQTKKSFTFDNYIKYKFSKYNIRSQSITLKTDAQ